MKIFRSTIWGGFIVALLLATGCVWSDSADDPDYLPLDDSEYPYANLPRLVIETDNFREIRNTTAHIPAKIQIYNGNTPETDVMDIDISGRGYSSFGMPKFSYKLKFSRNVTILDFPKGKSWDLIANYIDKSLLRNYLSYKLAYYLHTRYAPRTAFVELFVNRQYMGVFLLTEHIDVSKSRVNLPSTNSSFLLEMELPENDGSLYISTKIGTSFKVHFPKEKDNPYLDSLISFLDGWENYLYYSSPKNKMDKWFDFDEYIKYYWIQEFSKNNDAAYSRSIFFTWKKGDVIRMGPVWDFDVAYGNKPQKTMQIPENWHIRENGWNKPFFLDSSLKKRASDFWINHRNTFISVLDSIDFYSLQIKKASQNEYKRWNIQDASVFGNTSQIFHSHQESVDSLKSWISRRIHWIDNNHAR